MRVKCGAVRSSYTSKYGTFCVPFFTLLFVAISILSISLSYAILYPSTSSNALSSTKGAEVGVGVREFIKVAVDKSTLTLADNEGHTTIVPTAEGVPVSGTVNVA
ncbi:hypothetical protein IKG48_02310, partial [Candidatus Saccharibacteria bacterium]|nr:hypothetical protein [Candidatus Saccharibacteria bacterium]